MTLREYKALVVRILAECEFPGVTWIVNDDVNALTLQVQMATADNDSDDDAPYTWRGRKWRLSRHMTKSEIVQTAFLATLTAVEHEVREQFRFRGASVFTPHYNLDELVATRRKPHALDRR